MSDCCAPRNETDCCAMPADQDTASPVCRICGRKAKAVQRSTPGHLLKPKAAERLQDAFYRFCATPACDVVYFSNETGQYFHKADMRVRVGLKETEDPIPLCYCFGYTAHDVREEILTTGTPTIPEWIRIKVQAGNCRCELENPQGTCCLGYVSRAVKQAMVEAEAQVQA